MLRDEAIISHSKNKQFKIIHNHIRFYFWHVPATPPVFNTTKRLPGTTEYVAKIRPKVVKAVKE